MDTTLTLLTVFVAITTIAFVAQAFATWRLLLAAKMMKERVDVFLPKAEKFLQNSEEKMAESTRQIAEITSRANSIMALTHAQMVRVDEVMADASVRAKAQLEHAEAVLNNTLTHMNDTVNAVHGSILRPVRELNGVAAGVKAAVGHLLKGAPANVAQVTTDEEMFI